MNAKIYNIVILLSFLFAFASCADDDYETSANSHNSFVTLHLPEEATVEVKSRSIVDENTVDDVLVFLFRDGKAKYQSFVNPTNGVNTVSFTLTKFAVEAGETLYVVCNTGISSINDTNADDFLSKLTFSDKDNKMIMYGSKEISTAGNNISIQLERMLAKVTLTSDIAISSWKICNLPTKGIVGKANVYPADATFDRELSPATDNVYFVPRTDNSTTALPKTYLLVELSGRGWYKLDFCNYVGELDETANVPVLDLKSNTHYVFNIQTVKSNGYDTETEAAANPGSNVVYSMTTTENIGESNGQYMLQVDRDIITLYPGNASQFFKALELSAIIPSGSGSKISTYTVKLVNPSGNIKLDGDTDGDNILNLLESTKLLTGNSTHEIRLSCEGARIEDSYLEIQLGNIIRQIPMEILSANCYLVDFASTTGNTIYIPAVAQANKDGVTRIAEDEKLDVNILWCDQPDVDLSMSYDEKTQLISVTNNVAFTGNVVIVIKTPGLDVGFGDFRWSWHIWSLGSDVTEYDADRNIYDFKTDKTKDFNGFTWMDRNLGAYTLERTNDGSWGLLYQYGRKDPFPGARFDSPLKSKNVYCEGIRFTMEQDHPYIGKLFANVSSPNNLEYSIEHPMTFIAGMWYSTGDDCDWYTNDGTLRNNYLWLNEYQEKAPYNPCPSGWTLPFGGKSGPFVGLWPNAANATVYTEGVLYDEIGYVPFIPYRNENKLFVLYTTGSNIGSQMRWGNVNDNGVSVTTFSNQSVQHADITTRASAMPVRCVRENRD